MLIASTTASAVAEIGNLEIGQQLPHPATSGRTYYRDGQFTLLK